VALAAGIIVFATGLILLMRFHVGPEGAFRQTGLGLTRLTWVNVHRFSATVFASSILLHVILHWRAIVHRLRKLGRATPSMSRADPYLYFGFTLVFLAGFVAWLILPGSLNLLGPAEIEMPPRLQHTFIDIHNISGLVALVAAYLHVRRHFGWLLRRAHNTRKP
jgi:hypothetical protein